MPIANSYNISNVTASVTTTGPKTVDPVQTTSPGTTVVKKKTTVNSGKLGYIPNPAPPVPPQSIVTPIPSGPYIGPTTSAPPDVTPGVDTGTIPPAPKPKVPESSNTEVASNAIPEAVPTTTLVLPTASNTTANVTFIKQSNKANANANCCTTNIYNTYYSNIKVYDETTLVTNAVQVLTFTGAGVTVTGSGNAIINIPGGGGGNGSPAGNVYEIQWKGSKWQLCGYQCIEIY